MKIANLERRITQLQNQNKNLEAELNSNVKKEFEDVNERIQPSNTPEMCELCCKHLSKNELSQHLCLEKQKYITCPYCWKTFKSIADFLLHMKIHDEAVKADLGSVFYKCDQCPVVYTIPILLECHKKSHDNEEGMPMSEFEVIVEIDDNDESDEGDLTFEPIESIDDDIFEIDETNGNRSDDMIEVIEIPPTPPPNEVPQLEPLKCNE